MESSLNREKINQTGADILESADQMYNSLSRIKDLVDQSKNYFDSEAGESVRNKFTTSAEQFEKFRADLKSYGEFLKIFSDNVIKFETSVQDTVNSLPNL